MSHGLISLAKKADKVTEGRIKMLGILSFAFVIVAAFHQAGGAFVSWHVFDWLPLIGLGGAFVAFVCAAMRRWFEYLTVSFLAGLGLALFAPSAARFPGVHTQGLWLVFALVCGSAAFGALFAEPEDWAEYAHLRLAGIVAEAGAIATTGTMLVFRSWTMFIYMVIVAAFLLFVYLVLTKAQPREHYGLAVKT